MTDEQRITREAIALATHAPEWSFTRQEPGRYVAARKTKDARSFVYGQTLDDLLSQIRRREQKTRH